MRKHDPYKQIDPQTLIARDWLALSRTRLANERTLLAYARTSLSMIGLGAILAKWVEHQFALVGGMALAVLGVVVAVVGLFRFIQEDRRYRRLTHTLD